LHDITKCRVTEVILWIHPLFSGVFGNWQYPFLLCVIRSLPICGQNVVSSHDITKCSGTNAFHWIHPLRIIFIFVCIIRSLNILGSRCARQNKFSCLCCFFMPLYCSLTFRWPLNVLYEDGNGCVSRRKKWMAWPHAVAECSGRV
jgi:hypothetical protein